MRPARCTARAAFQLRARWRIRERHRWVAVSQRCRLGDRGFAAAAVRPEARATTGGRRLRRQSAAGAIAPHGRSRPDACVASGAAAATACSPTARRSPAATPTLRTIATAVASRPPPRSPPRLRVRVATAVAFAPRAFAGRWPVRRPAQFLQGATAAELDAVVVVDVDHHDLHFVADAADVGDAADVAARTAR